MKFNDSDCLPGMSFCPKPDPEGYSSDHVSSGFVPLLEYSTNGCLIGIFPCKRCGALFAQYVFVGEK